MIMKDSKTQRGFDITNFKDSYGAECSLQKSSSAFEPKIWLGVNDANPKIMVSDAKKIGIIPKEETGWTRYDIPKEVLLNTRMHLSQEQVKELLPYLNRFVETGSLF